MANEREEDGLFRKITEPRECYAVCVQHAPWHGILSAWNLESDAYRRYNFPVEYLPEDYEANAWVYRESARACFLWEQVPDFDLCGLVVACKRSTQHPNVLKFCIAPARSDITKIRFTPSPEYGKADRQIVTTLGKFLTRYYSDVMTEGEIREWANRYVAAASPAELKFAETPDEVERVYENGPESCMSGGVDSWEDNNLTEHPARLWGYCKSTRVAYIEENGEILARCLVREDVYPRCYIRVYPEGHPRMIAALKAAGYQHNREGLLGLRVPCIYVTPDDVLMPYVDGVAHARLEDDEIVLGYGDLEVQITAGYINVTGCRSRRCPSCGSRVPEDEIQYSDYHDGEFCPECPEDYVWANTGRHSADWVQKDLCVLVNGDWYLRDSIVLERFDLIELDNGDVVASHEAVELEDGSLVHIRDADETAWGTWVSVDDSVEDDLSQVCTKEDLHCYDQPDGKTLLVGYRKGDDNLSVLEEAFAEGTLLTVEQWIEKHAALSEEQLMARLQDDFAKSFVKDVLSVRRARAVMERAAA